MNLPTKLTMTGLGVAVLMLLAFLTPVDAMAQISVPNALSVEWQGQKPCEKLYEDAQILIARCTFPPGSKHLKHSHPGYLSYVLSGGKVQIEDAKGTRQLEPRTGSYANSPPIPWHELTNVGDTTVSYLVVERKYEPVTAGE
jgi:quercetin dioxygenase-like cupin family protein